MNKQKAWEEYVIENESPFPEGYTDSEGNDYDYNLSEELCLMYGLDTSFFDYVRTWPIEDQKEMGYL